MTLLRQGFEGQALKKTMGSKPDSGQVKKKTMGSGHDIGLDEKGK